MSDIPFFDSSEGGDDFFSQLSQSTVNPSPFQERPQPSLVLSQSAPFPSSTTSNFPPRNEPFAPTPTTTPFSATPTNTATPFATPLQNNHFNNITHAHRKSLSLTDTPADIPFDNSSDDPADFFSTLSISGTRSAPQSVEPQRHANPPLSVADLAAPKPTFAVPFPKQTFTPVQTPTPVATPMHTPAPTPVPFPGNATAYNPYTPIQANPVPMVPGTTNPVPMVPKTFAAPFPSAPMSPGIQRVANTEFHRTNSLPTFPAVTSPFGSPTKENMRSMSSGQVMQPRDYERKPHPIVAFGFGGKVITMIPRKRRVLFGNQPQDNSLDRVPNTFHVHSLQKLLGNTSHMQSLANFPGPLSSADKAQKFVADKINSPSTESFDPEASRLLWQLIKILCDHYGNISGVDNPAQKSIKEILTENLQANTQAPLLTSPRGSQEEHAAVLELQRLIVAGNVDEAYRFAVSAQLWSHALVLASYMSPDTFKATVAQFTDTSIREGSPIRTLYLLLAGRKQDLFGGSQTYTNALGGLLERWRENLVTLINSRTGDKQVISTLGDKLWAFQKKAEAAHFCYLTADLEFDYIDNPNTRMVLFGGDHKLCPRTFANPESIQRTEILEFARTLGNPQFSMPQIQPYKLIYALMLAEAGHLETAKKYVQAISNVISRNRNYPYNQFFLHHLEQLEQRLNGFSSKEFSATSSGSWIPIPKLSNIFKIGKWRSDSNPQPPAQEETRVTEPHVPPLNLSAINPPTSSPVTAAPAQPPPTEAEKTNESPRANVEASKKSESPGWGLTSKVSGLLSVFKLSNQADLGEDNAFEYNKELGAWIRKGEKPGTAATSLAGPPPPVFAAPPPVSAPPPSSGPPSSMDGPVSGPPSFTSPAANTRRMRYVDTFNQGAPPVSAPPRRDSGARQSLNFAGTIFTPNAMMPTEQPPAPTTEETNPNTFQTPFSQPPQNM